MTWLLNFHFGVLNVIIKCSESKSLNVLFFFCRSSSSIPRVFLPEQNHCRAACSAAYQQGLVPTFHTHHQGKKTQSQSVLAFFKRTSPILMSRFTVWFWWKLNPVRNKLLTAMYLWCIVYFVHILFMHTEKYNRLAKTYINVTFTKPNGACLSLVQPNPKHWLL